MATSSGDAPFCGPYTAAAPWRPSSGLSTSAATSTSIPASEGRPARSSRCSAASAAPPGGSSRPAWSSSLPPRACTMPAPPSVLATPPRPSTIRRAPRAAAAAMSSPTPKLVAASGCSLPPGSRASPHACAASMIAVPSRHPNSARAGCPVGPRTSSRTGWYPAATAAATVPSPPSATGTCAISRSPRTLRRPAAMCVAAWVAVSVPLNLSGATSTCPPRDRRDCISAPATWPLSLSGMAPPDHGHPAGLISLRRRPAAGPPALRQVNGKSRVTVRGSLRRSGAGPAW